MFWSAGFVFLLSACTGRAEKLEMGRASEAEQKKQYQSAYDHYKRVVDKNPSNEIGVKASQGAAKLAHYDLKKFQEAIELYRNVVLYSPDPAARLDAERKIADIEFSQLSDYTAAIAEYQKLLDLPLSAADEINYRFALAKSYFYLNDFYQSQVEIDALLKKSKDPQLSFDAGLLKANILLTSKDLDKAVQQLEELKQKDPARSKNENLDLVLAVTYEEQKNFAKAIETLEDMRSYYPRKDFIERRIKTLKDRQAQLPGAKGLKK